MTDRPLRAGGPSVYRLATESDIGGELYEREVVRRLPAHGVEVLIALPAGPGPELEPIPGVRVMRLPPGAAIHWLTAPLVLIPWTVRRLRRRELDVLRGPSVRWSGPSLLAARALCRPRIPVVIHHHHFEARWRRLEAAILRRADAVITVSAHSRSQLIAAGVDPTRIHITYNGIDGPGETRPEPAATWPADGLRLLCLGRLEARKQPRLAIDTVDQLTRAGQLASLVIAGEGPIRSELETHVATLGLGDRVRFLGRVEDARKWRLYDGADILLFGSTVEGFGLVVAEAQSRGLPVIAAAGTATEEALVGGESGLLVSPTPRAFADAVASLGDATRRAQMSERARIFAARFGWETCAEGVAAALATARP